ncbi:hypothetical protein GCM10022291_10130 [Postechiella marina]|uniref:Nicotinic acid mononucleotide adenyltransferase n=1 Tax=Postechiella marina TaxID=943941 RepID=A0ABP8C4Z2_9FLAO
MKNIFILLLALCTTVSFAQEEKVLKQDKTFKLNKVTNLIDAVYYHDNGKVSQTGSFTADGKLQGEWLSFDEKGNKTITAYYDNGKKTGKWIHVINGVIKEVNYSKNVASL